MKATMDRNVRGVTDPVAGPSNGERRRCVRQKLHTPVYASFNGPHTGVVLDLSELLDLHEDGFGVQTSERLEMNRAVTLCLDLPETRSYIHGGGQVIWSDEAGRGGIRFSPLPDSSRHILKEWLFANLLIACSNHQARSEQLARHEDEKLPEAALAADFRTIESGAADSRIEAPISGGSATLSLLVAVRGEILEIGDDFDSVLQLITERAVSLTGANGAALAFFSDGEMMCRARAGEPAPPLGSAVDIKQGLSGECVRSALPVWCADVANDPRIDPQVGRALGIGSLTAVPIVSGFQVVGLLEVFSTHPRAFSEAHTTILEGLVEMISGIGPDKTPPEDTPPENTKTETPSGPVAGSRPRTLESGSSESGSLELESGSSESGSSEFDSIPAIRNALKDRQPEAPEQLAHHGAEGIVSEQASEGASTAPSRLLYRALLGLAMTVVAMVIGYLLGPTIEKRWAEAGQAGPGQRMVDRALADQRSADQRLADQRSANQRAQAKSLPDLRKLADQGDADAQWQMGVRYRNGEDVPQDDAQAVQWFLRAAEQGNVAAQSALSSYYWAGRGVPEDLPKAYMWSEIALTRGDENSKSRLEGLASQMTRRQVSAARQQAEEWIHTHSQRAKSEPQ